MNKKRVYTKIGKPLGKSAFGTVSNAKDQDGNEIYAIKEFSFKEEKDTKNVYWNKRSIFIKRIKSYKYWKINWCFTFPKYFTLVFEFIETDLKKILEGRKKLEEKLQPLEIKSYLYQLLRGVAYMHKYKIIHCNLKLGNLLITKDNVLKISDFGLAWNMLFK